MSPGNVFAVSNFRCYDKFWKVYLELKNLHDDTSVFVDILKGYLSADGDNFINHTAELCSSKDNYTTTAVVELLSRIDDIRVLSVMNNIIDTGIHPCVVVEIVLKWWRVRTDTEHVDMSFITPLITTIQNVSCVWYYSVCADERYKDLTETLDIPEPTAACAMRDSNY